MRALLGALVVIALAGGAAATPYETFIDIDDQADLEDLLAAGDLTQDTYDELLELLERGVDLSSADRAQLYALPNLTYDEVDRILAYRDKQGGAIRDPAGLVAAGALSEDKLLAIAAFLRLSPPPGGLAVHGWLRGQTRFALRDRVAPPFALRGRFTVGRHLRAGFAASLSRLELGAPVFDPNRGALIAERRAYRVGLPKAFVLHDDGRTAVIAGTFRAGFAQRLTFDNSQHYTPNGLYLDDELYYAGELERDCRESAGELAASPCTGALGARYITPDFRYGPGLVGAGAGLKHVAAGRGWLQLYAWASSARRSIYQYELVDRARCADPHDDDAPGCAAPTVYVSPDGPRLTPTSRFAFETLPDVFVERLGGVHATYFADRRTAVGVTVYGAARASLVEGIELDTQEWSRFVTGGRYGAAGAHASIGRGWLDLFAEVAHSYDRLPDGPGPQTGGGGPAAIVRATATKPRQELEATLRYYSVDFANPYARPISQPDELDGQRARDELGARLRYLRGDRRRTIRALVDLWFPVSSFAAASPLGRAQPKLETYVRVDVQVSRALRPGLWLRYQDRDLGAGGHTQCFTSSTFELEGEPVPCSGRQLTTTARARLDLGRELDATALVEHQLLDDGVSTTSPFRDRYRQDLSAAAIGRWRPDRDVRMRARLRYLHEAFNSGRSDYLERSIAGTFEAQIALRRRDQLRGRIDVKRWLDTRESSVERSPNPELQLWLSYEARL